MESELSELQRLIRDQLGFDPAEEIEIEGDTPDEDDESPPEYAITSFGADWPVDGLVKRLDREVILTPEFQRGYVWPMPKASRFIESLLLGLPVPGIFLAREENNLLVIDGQQRLKTLQFFFKGRFADTGREFRLTNLKSRFNGLIYDELEEGDRQRLEDYTIHATIVQQDEPDDDKSSIIHLFERLNTGGMQLVPQEIRACVYHGKFNALLAELNDLVSWRDLFGAISKRMRDREMILRFFALFHEATRYAKPMNQFLDNYMRKMRNANEEVRDEHRRLFTHTVTTVQSALGREAFRPARSFNASRFDSVMYGVAMRLRSDKSPDPEVLKKAYKRLAEDTEYQQACSSGTTDESSVGLRLKKAFEAFAE